MKIDVNQINVGDFVQINLKEVATSEIRHYVKEGEWYEVVDKDSSVAPLKIKFTEDFSYWVLECRILTYKKKEEIVKENEQVEWKVGDEFEFKSGNEEFMKDWEYSMNKRYTVKRVGECDVVAKNDKGQIYYVNFDRIQKVNPVEELSREEKVKQLRSGDEIYIIPEKIDARMGYSFGLSSEEKYVVMQNDGSDIPIRFSGRGAVGGFWAKSDEIFLLEEKECIRPDIKEESELKEEKEQVEWKVGDKFTIKSSHLGLLEGLATTETIFEVTDVIEGVRRVKFDSTEYGGWRDDGRHIDDIIKVEDGCEPIEKQEEKEEMEIKVGDFVKIKKEEFEYLCRCTKKRGGRCNVSQDDEYEVVKNDSQLDGIVLIDFKDLDGDVVNGVYAHRFYKVSKKQEEEEEMKSVERTAFNFDCHEQIKEKLNYLNLSQVAKDDILGLVELYVEKVVEQMMAEFEQEIDQRYQEKLESLKKVLDI